MQLQLNVQFRGPQGFDNAESTYMNANLLNDEFFGGREEGGGEELSLSF